MEITCYRDAACAQEDRTLPAATYNLAHTLLVRAPGSCLFVPIRAMQYLAILDHEEFIFLDGERKCWVDISWQHFRPDLRDALNEPVAYEAVYYRPDAPAIMDRLLAELPRALRELSNKTHLTGPARVLKFPAP